MCSNGGYMLGIWHLVFSHFGVLTFWCFDMLVFWHFGVLRFWVLTFWGFDILGFWHFGSFDILGFWHFGVWHFGVAILGFWHFGVQLLRSISELFGEPLLKTVLLHTYIIANKGLNHTVDSRGALPRATALITETTHFLSVVKTSTFVQLTSKHHV